MMPSGCRRGPFSIFYNKNGPNCLLTRGMPGGNIKKFLSGVRLIKAEFMH
jgi:hypothetical protein